VSTTSPRGCQRPARNRSRSGPETGPTGTGGRLAAGPDGVLQLLVLGGIGVGFNAERICGFPVGDEDRSYKSRSSGGPGPEASEIDRLHRRRAPSPHDLA
jgi:hypothetical protein